MCTTTMWPESSAEILVIGAGPSGLTLACQLLRHGARCRVIDAAAGPSATSKAFAIHARSLEIFDDIGIADKLVQRGQQVRSMEIMLEERRLGVFDFSALPGRFPFVLSLPQSETEAVLARRFEQLGGRVEWWTALDGLHQDAHGVTARLVSGDGRAETASFSWVVGCDGAHSTVRKLLEIPFEGSISDSGYIVADGRLRWDGPRDRGSLFMSPLGYAMVFAFPGEARHRVVLSNAGNADATLDTVNEQLRLRGIRGAEMSDPLWMSGARYHRRLAAAYRKGRVFLAGDAAHIHSPVGGQGLNTGIQDAYNLGWKLARVQAAQALESVLDSYEMERRPVAGALLRRTDRMTQALTVSRPIQRQLRKWIMPAVARSPLISRKLTSSMAGLDVAYAAGPLVVDERAGLLRRPGGAAAGRRAPDAMLPAGNGSPGRMLHDLFRGTHATLLLFTGITPSAAGEQRLRSLERSIVASHGSGVRCMLISSAVEPGPETLADPVGKLHRLYGIRSEGACLVRPDGYIGYRCRPASEEKLRSYLGRIFDLTETFTAGVTAVAIMKSPETV